MLRLNIFLVSLLLLQASEAQQWQKIETIRFADTPTAYSIDLQGDIYVGFKNGSLRKYNAVGDEMVNYSLPNQSSISLIEAQNRLRLFTFNFDNQSITLLDRFSTIPKTYSLSEMGINLALLACPSPDAQYWVVETNPQRLKKIDPLQKAVLLEVQTTLGDSIKFMKAFQNLLIITDEDGLHVFDQFGSKINSMNLKKIKFLQLKDNQLIVLINNKILFIDPFSVTIAKEIKAPIEASTVMLAENSYLFFEGKEMHLFSDQN